MTTKTHQKNIIKENAPHESAKFYNDQQNPKECKAGMYVILTPLLNTGLFMFNKELHTNEQHSLDTNIELHTATHWPLTLF